MLGAIKILKILLLIRHLLKIRMWGRRWGSAPLIYGKGVLQPWRLLWQSIENSRCLTNLILNVGLQQTLARQLCFDWLLAIDSYWEFKNVLNKRSNFSFAHASCSGLFFINFSLSSQSFFVSSFLCLTSTLFLFYFLFFIFVTFCILILVLPFVLFAFLLSCFSVIPAFLYSQFLTLHTQWL